MTLSVLGDLGDALSASPRMSMSARVLNVVANKSMEPVPLLEPDDRAEPEDSARRRSIIMIPTHALPGEHMAYIAPSIGAVSVAGGAAGGATA